MRSFHHAGPGLVALAAAAVALVATPALVRRANDAQASADIERASLVLETPFRATDAGVEPVAARKPLATDDAPPAGAEVDEFAGLSFLEAFNRANRAIAKLVEPSVVHVSTLATMQRRNFAAPYASSGSGWIWDEDGHVVTNAHVVEGAERLQVQLFDGELREAELVGLDLRTDIAVIKVAAGGLHPSRRGSSGDVAQGDLVYAFGSPFDFRFSMSTGIVSGLGRSAGLADIDYENFIQTDAAINPGNSGGPLTDVRGRVIGMNTAIATGRGNSVGQGQFAGIGLAIPMSMIESVVTQVIESGEVRKGFLGVSVMPVDALRAMAAGPRGDDMLRAIAGEFKGEGAVVSMVSEGSPAEAAGFTVGDVITSIDGQKVASDAAVPAIVSSRRPGDEVEFEIWRLDLERRSGERQVLVATLGEFDTGERLAPYMPRALRAAGVDAYATATAARAKSLGVPFRRGVLIESVDPSSDLAEIAPAGSVITAVFDQSVGSLDEFYTRVSRAVSGMGRMRRIEVPLTITVPDGRVVQVAVPLR